MTERFVPLEAKTTAISPGDSFRVRVLPNVNGAAVPFQPLGLLPGRSPAHVAPGEHSGQPQVMLVRDGDRITGLRVQCACGEVIELQCVY